MLVHLRALTCPKMFQRGNSLSARSTWVEWRSSPSVISRPNCSLHVVTPPIVTPTLTVRFKVPIPTRASSRLVAVLRWAGLFCLLSIVGCSDVEPTSDERLARAEVPAAKPLRIGTLNLPGTFLQDEAGSSGTTKTLTTAFSKSLGTVPEYLVYNSRSELVDAVAKHEVHFGAATLPIVDADRQQIRYSSQVTRESISVVYRRGSLRPRKVEDLTHRKVVAALAPPGFTPPTLIGIASTTQALTAVDQREADAAIVLTRHLFGARLKAPALRQGFALPTSIDTAWLFPRDGGSRLYRRAQRWLLESKRNGLMANLLASSNDHYLNFDHVAILLWRRHLRSRLPKFEALFREMGERHQLDWRLLAAVSYQESHWNPEAVSPTGVRGLMMLTQATARQLGIKKRTDPRQSVEGGARYLRQLLERVPNAVHAGDRMWFALASYNIGFGHVRDAMMLTAQYARDPHYWHNLRKFLPLLEDAQYHRRTRYGYARGREPVRYVGNIRRFYEALRYETQGRPPNSTTKSTKTSEN